DAVVAPAAAPRRAERAADVVIAAATDGEGERRGGEDRDRVSAAAQELGLDAEQVVGIAAGLVLEPCAPAVGAEHAVGRPGGVPGDTVEVEEHERGVVGRQLQLDDEALPAPGGPAVAHRGRPLGREPAGFPVGEPNVMGLPQRVFGGVDPVPDEGGGGQPRLREGVRVSRVRRFGPEVVPDRVDLAASREERGQDERQTDAAGAGCPEERTWLASHGGRLPDGYRGWSLNAAAGRNPALADRVGGPCRTTPGVGDRAGRSPGRARFPRAEGRGATGRRRPQPGHRADDQGRGRGGSRSAGAAPGAAIAMPRRETVLRRRRTGQGAVPGGERYRPWNRGSSAPTRGRTSGG